MEILYPSALGGYHVGVTYNVYKTLKHVVKPTFDILVTIEKERNIMPNNKYYLINSPKVVDEIFEDEIIVINFDNGDYFSLKQSATNIWEGIKNGQSIEMILENLQTKYKVNEQEVRKTVLQMIDVFLKENLISPQNEVPEKNDIIIEESTTKIPFEPPIFEKFTDMNDLLLLDPVHDVDESGWPHVDSGGQNG